MPIARVTLYICVVACAQDSVGALAAEVRAPGSDLPRAMVVTIVLVTIVYLLPLAVSISMDHENLDQWTDGHFTIVAQLHVGDWLSAWISLGGALSAVGLLNTLLCTAARVAASAARLYVLPPSLGKLERKDGMPRRATIAISCLLVVACALPFSELVSISMLFYGATTGFEFCSLVVLRYSEPHTPRPYRIPLSDRHLAFACIPPVSLCFLLICLAPREAMLFLLFSMVFATLTYFLAHGCDHSSASHAWRPFTNAFAHLGWDMQARTATHKFSSRPGYGRCPSALQRSTGAAPEPPCACEESSAGCADSTRVVDELSSTASSCIEVGSVSCMPQCVSCGSPHASQRIGLGGEESLAQPVHEVDAPT